MGLSAKLVDWSGPTIEYVIENQRGMLDVINVHKVCIRWFVSNIFTVDHQAWQKGSHQMTQLKNRYKTKWGKIFINCLAVVTLN